MSDEYEPLDDECVDKDGEVWPEHDFHGNTCRRCDAESEESE
jgi:hypothetical protein